MPTTLSEYDKILKAEMEMRNYRRDLITVARSRATNLPPVFMLGLKHSTLDTLIKSDEPATLLVSTSFWHDLKTDALTNSHITESDTVRTAGVMHSLFLGGWLGKNLRIPILNDVPLFESQRFLEPAEAFILLDHTIYNIDDLLVLMSKAEPLKLARITRAIE
jgi:hypothetical protein